MENNEILDSVNFDESSNPYAHIEIASNTKRFLTYFMDSILLRITDYSTTYFLILSGYASYFFGRYAILNLILINFFVNIMYYWVCESFLGGQTLGKLVTGTKVLYEDGTKATPGRIFIRTLIRFIPFEVFSIFFETGIWHDEWSKTMVIDIDDSDLLSENELVQTV
jgi:uncharacterized RDD family membrane protein YckC